MILGKVEPLTKVAKYPVGSHGRNSPLIAAALMSVIVNEGALTF
jgi:hypothetical protein